MKSFILSLTLFVSSFVIGQTNSVNYKALIKDSNGNIVANQSIDVRFTVIANAGPTIVYQETHSGATTDINGIVILNIGEGTPIITPFTDIDWGSGTHSLQVEIDIEQDASYVDLGTTPFSAVPYALHAKTADYNSLSNLPSITDPSGLEAINEGDGLGYRLVNKNSLNYGNIGSNAVDLSHSGASSSTRGATGNFSFTSGYYTTASGSSSTALGHTTVASGISSIALGSSSTASGNQSLAMGVNSIASGNQSFAMGVGINAASNYAISVGRYNIGGGNPSSWVSTDPLFEVGNGASNGSRSNALTVLKNGRVGIGTNTPDRSLSVNGSLSLWEDTAPASLTALRVFGDQAIWYNGTYFSWGFGGSANYFADNVGIGTTTPDVPLQITNGLDVNLSNGTGQLLLGNENGSNLAIDSNEIQARNNGAASTLLLQAEGGKINIGNSVVIEDNVPVRITNASDVNLSNGSGYLVLGSDTGTNVAFDNNEIQARNNGAVADITLQHEGGKVITGSNLDVGNSLNVAFNATVQHSLFVVGGDIWLNGGVQHYSDRRLKRNIENISYGLDEVLKLRPTEYFWKDKEQKYKSLGLIAQEVDQVIKNVVTYQEKNDRFGVSYTELIPVLIKAIQEQQEIINKQDQKINQLNEVVAKQDVLNKRIEKLEALLSNNQ